MTNYRESLRGRILEVALNAFATHGIRAVKMDDIAQQLGISKRTLYETYENKEQLVLEGLKKYHQMKDEEARLIDQQSANVMDLMLKIYHKKVSEFKTTCPQFYTDIMKYPRVLDFLHGNRQKAHEHLLLFLRRGVDEGYFRNDVSLELIAIMFDAIIDAIMTKRLFNHYSIELIFHDLVLVSLRGFCTPLGVKELDLHFPQTND